MPRLPPARARALALAALGALAGSQGVLARAASGVQPPSAHSTSSAAAASGVADGAPAFLLKVTPTGAFSFTLPAWPAAVFTSSEVGVRVNGSWYSSANGGMSLASAVSPITGADTWGAYTGYAAAWMSTPGVPLYTTWKVYSGVPALVFDQFLPEGIAATGAVIQDRDGVVTSFPSFTAPNVSSMGIMHFEGPFIDNDVFGPAFVPWKAGTMLLNGMGGGPAVFFDATASHALVFSSLNNFMAGSMAQNARGDIMAGLMGYATSVPAQTSYSTVMWYGTGPNAAMMSWGAALLAYYGKAADGALTDYTNNYLMYNTDHGAYYYYNLGPYANYLDMLMAVYNYSQSAGIPYKAVLLDSWWYYKSADGGVKNWTAMPDVFPGGNAGIRQLAASTGWKITAHNRYWATDTDYATANGGKYNFYIDSPNSPAGGGMSVPLDGSFWPDLLQTSVREWGLTTYEQDWLYNELLGVDILQYNTTAGREWLLQMNHGAALAGVTIQMCMPFPRHVLQSVEMSQVTQCRVSDDHVPGNIEYHFQWRIGLSSILSWALALAPFKDNYYSQIGQPGSSVGSANDTSPSLQGAISVLSMGPVSPGDGVGMSNVAEIMRTVNAGGRILKPSRAATSVDAQILNHVFPGVGVDGEVYATYSMVSGWVWDHILAAHVNASYFFTPADLSGIHADLHLHVLPSARRADRHRLALGHDAYASNMANLSVVAYSMNATSLDPATLRVQAFAAGGAGNASNSGFWIPRNDEADFVLWHTAPVFSNGWAYLGELSKYVPVSPVRTTGVSLMATDLLVALTGEPGERVDVTFWNAATSATTTVSCILGEDGTAQAAMPYGTC